MSLGAKLLREILPQDYGYVVLAVAGGSLMNLRHIFLVVKAREKYGIKAPQTYSEEHPEFNRTMRAHLNYLENYPFFTVTMLLGGLEFPRVCAGAGVAWLISRKIFCDAYIKNAESGKRQRGFGPAALAHMVMLGCTVIFGLRLNRGLTGFRPYFMK
ncbi:glutathione S-transferase 3, mitochondrial-like [Watersipora subatra]|uniref:glutathione S-transferase 3, mitochondrial-like n=1 Tax=Watersipora subatra TaxID=2589382 RepID=UPI00355AF385